MRDAGRVCRPRRTVRLRLTVLYGGMFCACGAGLLAITYLLSSHFSGARTAARAPWPDQLRALGQRAGRAPAAAAIARPAQASAQADLVDQHSSDLHELLVWSLVALAVMTAVVDRWLGWLVAGRVLAPLRTMTAARDGSRRTTCTSASRWPVPRDELRELGDTIDDLLARLEAAFGAQRRFVANASHELRTPLARIRTALDVALGKPGSVSPQVIALDRKDPRGPGPGRPADGRLAGARPRRAWRVARQRRAGRAGSGDRRRGRRTRSAEIAARRITIDAAPGPDRRPAVRRCSAEWWRT